MKTVIQELENQVQELVKNNEEQNMVILFKNERIEILLKQVKELQNINQNQQ